MTRHGMTWHGMSSRETDLASMALDSMLSSFTSCWNTMPSTNTFTCTRQQRGPLGAHGYRVQGTDASSWPANHTLMLALNISAAGVAVQEPLKNSEEIAQYLKKLYSCDDRQRRCQEVCMHVENPFARRAAGYRAWHIPGGRH